MSVSPFDIAVQGVSSDPLSFASQGFLGGDTAFLAGHADGDSLGSVVLRLIVRQPFQNLASFGRGNLPEERIVRVPLAGHALGDSSAVAFLEARGLVFGRSWGRSDGSSLLLPRAAVRFSGSGASDGLVAVLPRALVGSAGQGLGRGWGDLDLKLIELTDEEILAILLSA